MRRLLFLSLTLGCSGGSTTDPGKTDSEETEDTEDTEDNEPAVETECDDEVDDDGDGDTDCDDDDCEGEEHCLWPTALDFETLIQYEASLLAQLGGYDDCAVHVTASLVRDRQDSCPGCDRVYRGDFTFVADDCPDDFDRPSDGGYGVTFNSPTSWEVFGRVEGNWTSLGIAEDDGSGTLRIADVVDVEVSGIDGGTVSTFFAFTPEG